MMVRNTFVLCIAMAFFLFMAACMGLAFPGEMVITLLLGWVRFIARTVGEVQVDWTAVMMGAAVLVLLVCSTHWFFRSSYSGTPSDKDSIGLKWRWRWTMAALSIALFTLGAGVSIIGIACQIAWLARSKDPFLITGGHEAQWRSGSFNNLKQMGLAFHTYYDGSNSIPPGGTFDTSGQPYHSWQTFLLPFVEQRPLYEQIALDQPWQDPRNAEPFRTRLPVYTNPAFARSGTTHNDRQGYAASHYAANGWAVGGRVALTFTDFRDGTSYTLLAGEVAANFKPWGDPTNWRDPELGINKSPDGFGSPFKGGAIFLLADGAVRFVRDDLDPQVLRALSTPFGGEPNPDDF